MGIPVLDHDHILILAQLEADGFHETAAGLRNIMLLIALDEGDLEGVSEAAFAHSELLNGLLNGRITSSMGDKETEDGQKEAHDKYRLQSASP